MKGRRGSPGNRKKFLTITIIFALVLSAGMGTFIYQLYTRIVDESKMIAWEMTLKAARVLDLRLENIQRELFTFSRELSVGDVDPDEVDDLIECEMNNPRIFRMYAVSLDGKLLSGSYGMDKEEASGEVERLMALCPKAGIFSTNYIGKSGRWQTAIAGESALGDTPCRIYQECILDELYLDDFMEFYNNQGYSYVISGTEGEFVMLPKNRFGQGLYSDLFTMLKAYESNTPEVLDKIHDAIDNGKGCAVQLKFREEKSFFCFAPLEDNPEWFVVSVIPARALQKNGMDAIAAVGLMGIVLLGGVFCLVSLNHRRMKMHFEMEAAKKADKAKTSFLSTMSHEMRTPMNAIIGMTEIMRLDMADQNRMEECIGKIHTSSNYLLGIINDVLDMSKIESSKMTLEASPFLIHSVLDTAVNLIMSQVKNRKQNFSADVYWKGAECLIGDEKRISQILVNILANASKYTPEGGNIQLRVYCEKDNTREKMVSLRFEVEDNGIGISHEFQKILFEPFAQEKSSLSKGTGLGMAITAQMVHLMGGEISVKSELNKGSTFRVFLTIPQAWEEDQKNNPLQGKKIMMVGCKRRALQAQRITLSEVGMEVICADLPDNALQLLKQGREADMILAEGELGTLTEELAAFAHKADILFYLTGYGSEDVAESLLKQSDGYVLKPLLPSKLVQLMEKKRRPSSPGEEQPLKGCHILMAEDNELNAEIATELLGHFGAEVEWSINGQDVCERFGASKAGCYDLILMDIQMPKLNGYEAAIKIRIMEHPDAKKIPILAMTADAFAEDVAHAMNCGMNGHIAKPIDMKILIDEIKKVTEEEEHEEEH